MPGKALPHVEAFKALLEATVDPPVFLGRGPDNPPAVYYVLYPDAGAVEQHSLTPDEGFLGYIPMHAVASGPEQALWAIDQARDAVVGVTPTVPGRDCWRIWQQQSPPPLIRDDDVNPPRYVAFAEFGMRSQPA